MELGKNIKIYRESLNLSQEKLSEKVYVSRQTISSWENGKSYPDVNSLILLSKAFGTSIDNLIKGDLIIMEKKIKDSDIRKFNKLTFLFAILFCATIITPIPLVHFFGDIGIVIWAGIVILALYVAILTEREKKKHNIQTYKEILAFTKDENLDEIAKAREEGKRMYQKIFLALISGIATIIIGIIFILIFKEFPLS